MKSVTTTWADEHANEINLIDVRTPAEYQLKNIVGSKNVPITGLIANHDTFLNKEDTYYIICASGGRSSRAVEELEKLGYKNLVNVDGGIKGLTCTI